METIEPILTSNPVFKSLNDAEIKLLVGCAANAVFGPDQTIFSEGQEANTFYIVRHGRVIVEVFSPWQGPICIQTCTPGDVVGWSWLIPPFKWRFDAKATEQTRMITLDGRCLRSKCETDHSLGFKMMQIFTEIMAERLDATRLQLLDIYGK
jgi:CRP/FNR family transcriptional regulator, cyclic AMP receptor protein